MGRKKKPKLVDLTEFGIRGDLYVRHLSSTDLDILFISWYVWNEAAIKAADDHDKEMSAGPPDTLLGTAAYTRAKTRGPEFPPLVFRLLADIVVRSACDSTGTLLFRPSDVIWLGEHHPVSDDVRVNEAVATFLGLLLRIAGAALKLSGLTSDPFLFIRKYCDKYSPGYRKFADIYLPWSDMFNIMTMGNTGGRPPGAKGRDDEWEKQRILAADIHQTKHKRPIHGGEWPEVKSFVIRETELSGKTEREVVQEATRQALFITAGEIKIETKLLAPTEDVLEEVRRKWGAASYEGLTGRKSVSLPQRGKINPGTLDRSTDKKWTAQGTGKEESDLKAEFFHAELEAVGIPMEDEPLDLRDLSAEGMTEPEASYLAFEELREKLTEVELDIVQSLRRGEGEAKIIKKYKWTRDEWNDVKELIIEKIMGT